MQYVQAKHYTPTNGRQIDLIVIHDAEVEEYPDSAEGVANYFAGANAPQASAHYTCDVDSTVQSVRDIDVAWHAPGANHNGIGIEHAGFASQEEAEWLDEYSEKMLREQSAPLVTMLCISYGIPGVFVNADGLLRGERGITTHWEVTKAFRQGSHWDPGYSFPMDWYLQHVNGDVSTIPSNPSDNTVVDDGMLSIGDLGIDVTYWQRILIGGGYLPAGTDDGDFGPQTEAATKEFQTALNVTADGIVGPDTKKATANLLAWLITAQNTPPNLSTTAPPFPGRVMGKGDNGGDVAAAQDQLAHRGWTIGVDGDFGPQTDDVVRSFQSEKGLTVDGLIGPDTWNALWTTPVT